MPQQLELGDIQGLVARGYGGLTAARFVLLTIDDAPSARRWLADLVPSITSGDERPDDTALHIALSHDGLEKLGFPPEALATFSLEFREGMTPAHRQRSLGDVNEDAPGNWQWGGPSTPQIDAALLLYARDEPAIAPLLTAQLDAAASGGLRVQAVLDTSTVLDREAFGFRDGISQPFIRGLGRTGPPENSVRAGEFVLGYENEYGLLTDIPQVPASTDKTRALAGSRDGSGQADFGRNGSYLVFRQLEQDPVAFWKHIDAATRDASGESDAEARDLLAAKMVGRWPSGTSLVESPYYDDPQYAGTNDFGYHERDPDGLRCPVGSHVRRTNPRDSLDPDPGTAASYEINRRHRLLRRGRPYGALLSASEIFAGSDGDGSSRGLHFICLCGNIARQFEFVQQTWIHNPKFDQLYDDVDPLMGPRGPHGATFTVPGEPVRQRFTGLPSFVTVRGGGYFFLPGIRALRYLAALGS